jgi:hypothetical protein
MLVHPISREIKKGLVGQPPTDRNRADHAAGFCRLPGRHCVGRSDGYRSASMAEARQVRDFDGSVLRNLGLALSLHHDLAPICSGDGMDSVVRSDPGGRHHRYPGGPWYHQPFQRRHNLGPNSLEHHGDCHRCALVCQRCHTGVPLPAKVREPRVGLVAPPRHACYGYRLGRWGSDGISHAATGRRVASG